jgi:N-acetylglucosamine-6-phosphate deacetylase
MLQAYTSLKIFTGEQWLTGVAVLAEDGIIRAVLPKENIPEKAQISDFGDCFLAPCFIDIQIYGAYNALLSVDPTPSTLAKMYEYCKQGGAPYFQPTVATNSYSVFHKCIEAVRDYWNAGGKGVLGLHVEGPWISKEKKGAHIEACIHAPTPEQVKALLEYGKGVITMITLAPEVCSAEVIDLVQSSGVVVSAGHSNATFDQATYAFDNGIGAATHLYNAMSPLQHRAPGMVGAIMQHATVKSSIVADGHHVDFSAINIAKKLMGDRLFYITDAVTETQQGPYPHTLEGDKYVANGILSGSALTMAKCVKNGVEQAGIELSESLRMASLYPAQVMKLVQQLGKIEKGYRADFAVMNDNLEVVKQA